MLLLPVLDVLSPGLACEDAAFLLAGITSVHLLVSLQFAGDGEAHLASFISALVRGKLSVLFAHVGFKLLVLPELEPTTLELAYILLVLLGVEAVHMSGPVRAGAEGLLAAIFSAGKQLQAAVAELMPGQVIRPSERLPTAVSVTCVRLYSCVFT